MIIAPYEGDFAAALATAARAKGWETACAKRSLPLDPTVSTEREGARENRDLPWNPASYVSAAALALSAEASPASVETLVLICDAGSAGASLFDGSPGGLAASLEAGVSGPVYLCREMARRFDARSAGRILLVSVEGPTGKGEGHAPGSTAFQTLVGAAFRGLGEGLFDRAKISAWSAWGLVDRSGKPEVAADFALRLLDEQKTGKSGRWLPFNGKAGLFGVF